MNILEGLESAIAEVPENVGKALSFIGEKVDELGQMLEALAARMDKLEQKDAAK